MSTRAYRAPRTSRRSQPSWRRALATLAIVYMIAATSWSMPAGFPLKPAIDDRFRKIFQITGLWQGWDMFAPTPRNEDIYVSSEILYADGSTETWNISRMVEMTYWQRYKKERWRKFFNDNLRTDSNKAMWEPAARWIARAKKQETGKEVIQVRLTRHWRASLRPGEPGDLLDDHRPYNQFLFHEWKASSGETPSSKESP